MGIRIKLMLPILIAFLIYEGIIHFYWAPRLYEQARTDFIRQMQQELAVIESDLVRHLLAGDFSALYASLDYQLRIHDKSWEHLAVYDQNEKLIYPLVPSDQDEALPEHRFNVPLEHPLIAKGRMLGRVSVYVNWSEQYELARRRTGELEIYLGVILIIVFLVKLAWEYKVIIRPLSDLNQATERLSEGDFSATLPVPSSDEIGQLTRNFLQMRVNLMTVQEKLQRKTREAMDASLAKTRFVTTMSHEIRTPLNGIVGMTQVLAATRLDPEQQEMVDLLEVSCNHLSSVLSDVLDFAKIEAGTLALEIGDVDLKGVAKEAVALLKDRADKKGLALDLSYEAACPRVFRTDGNRIRQVLLNLLSNGIKFTEYGSVRMAVACIDEGQTACRVRFRVSDTGKGVPEEKRDAIFEAFSKAEDAFGLNYGGTGLGLAISLRLARLMGGTLKLEETAGPGAVFSFELSLEKGETPLELLSLPGGKTQGRTPSFKGHRVLLVEDNPVNQRVVQKMVSKTGLQVDIAGDGRKAVEMVREKTYDLVLMDYQMPVMDGIQATEEIRSWERSSGRRPVPIVALTANVLEHYVRKCYTAGMNDFLAKPVKMSALLDVLDRYLNGATPMH